MASCSIIICTRDRASSLRQTLAALAVVTVPAGWEAEVIVVDNGSTDGTAEVVAAARLPNMACRYVREPRGGQCYARNAGLAAANGEAIVFTDDDVVPGEKWLSALCSPIFDGEADVVGGEVVLPPDLQRPWMTRLHRNWLAGTDRDAAAGEPPRVVGANMAFSRGVLERVPRFDTALGPGQLGFGDDILFVEQLRAAGYRIAAAPAAVVEHHFDPDRLTRASFISAARKHGQTMAYLDCRWRGRAPRRARAGLAYVAARLLAWRLGHPTRWLGRTEGADPAEMYHVQMFHYLLRAIGERQAGACRRADGNVPEPAGRAESTGS